MTDLSDIKNILEKKNLSSNVANIARDCMVELCDQCGTKKKLAKLGSLFENLTEAIIILDLDLNILETNKLGEDFIKKFKNCSYDGKDYHLKKLPIVDKVLLTSIPSENLEMTSYDNLNKKHIFTVGCSPVFSERNTKVGLCLIIGDITEIHKQASQLEDIVSALTHDLKTPLVAAEISLKHLLDGHFGNLTDAQKEILTLLLQSNSDALKLVKNLLTVFKYERKAYKLLLEVVEVGYLIEKAINVVKPILDEKKINLRVVPSNFLFNCDPFEIERVIINLLSNAIKYTSPGGNIEIRVVKNENGTVIFTIEDNGKGILREDMPNLFNRFWQSKKTEDKLNSTGLGLYLCRQIIETHGGKIWAESEFGNGTKVIFEIPQIIG